MLNYTTYVLDEKAEWVTFVHGAGGSSTIWYKQIRDFKERYNVLLVDLRGHGKSKKIAQTKKLNRYTFHSIGDDIIGSFENSIDSFCWNFFGNNHYS
jgi:pimeloyl-ACP methyl ester carboxylesterase